MIIGDDMGIFDILFGTDDKEKNQQDYGLFSFLNDEQNNKNKSNNKDDNYDYSEDWQKKELKKGNYDSDDFEEDDIDEDSYYIEDDN
jgi:hypothetical protein